MNEYEKLQLAETIEALNQQHDLVMSLQKNIDADAWMAEMKKLHDMAQAFQQNYPDLNAKLNEQGVGAFPK